MGTSIESKKLTSFLVGGTVEFRPAHSVVSFIAEPNLMFYSDSKPIFTFPLYLKFSSEKKFRIGPVFGLFIRSTGNYGWSAGGEADIQVKEKGFVFIRGDFVMDYWTETLYGYRTGGQYTDNASSVFITLGFRKKILKKSKK